MSMTNGPLKRHVVEVRPEEFMHPAFVKQMVDGAWAPKEEPRAPMLSDVETLYDRYEDGPQAAAQAILDYYESLITSGVLRVVKKAHNLRNDNSFQCSACLFSLATAACTVPGEVGLKGADRFTCCPGCGASITRP